MMLERDPERVAPHHHVERDPERVGLHQLSVAARKRARACLTRHFIRHFLDIGFMSPDDADGVRRVMLGVLSVAIAIGLWLPRLLGGKYGAVGAVPDAYRSLVLGDTLMTFAFAMLAAAFAAALAGDSMFPDETDFRVLTPLPITRGFVFAAKLRAVALYLGLVIVVVSLALQMPFTALAGRHMERTWILRAASHVTASMAGSLFAALAVMSIQGVIVLCAPGRYLRPMTVGARTALLCAAVMLLPLAGRVPGLTARFGAESPLLYLVPPAWFAALQRISLGAGGAYDMRLGAFAVAAFAAVAALVASCYVILYRRFDVIVLRGNMTSGRSDASPRLFLRHFDAALNRLQRTSDPQTAVIQRFASRTLWRSPLHQVVFLGITACGVGWVTNGLLGAGFMAWIRDGGVPPPRLVTATVGIPFVLILAGVTGLRGALLLPQDPRANWIFRMSDEEAYRSGQLDAVEGLFMRLVVLPVLAVSLPLQWVVLGGQTVASLAIACLCGVLLVEVVIRNWRRIPFTCSYIPGKRHVAETVLLALLIFTFFTIMGRGLVAFSRTHPSRFLIAGGLLLAVLGLLRWRRLNAWGLTPLEFDDDPPEFAQPLNLS